MSLREIDSTKLGTELASTRAATGDRLRSAFSNKVETTLGNCKKRCTVRQAVIPPQLVKR